MFGQYTCPISPLSDFRIKVKSDFWAKRLFAMNLS